MAACAVVFAVAFAAFWVAEAVASVAFLFLKPCQPLSLSVDITLGHTEGDYAIIPPPAKKIGLKEGN